jgi:hypothetical protein
MCGSLQVLPSSPHGAKLVRIVAECVRFAAASTALVWTVEHSVLWHCIHHVAATAAITWEKNRVSATCSYCLQAATLAGMLRMSFICVFATYLCNRLLDVCLLPAGLLQQAATLAAML